MLPSTLSHSKLLFLKLLQQICELANLVTEPFKMQLHKHSSTGTLPNHI
jgi:hypothetical protein